jgi:putative ABC transport system permease protein
MLENIKLSIQGIWSHKLRSLLTMLGIIIGIAAIIAIVSAIQGTNERLKEKLIGQGNNLVQVQLYEDSWTYSYGDYSSSPTGVNPITDTMLEEIKNLDHVANASTYNSRTESNIYVGSSQKSGYVYGVDNSYFTTTGYIIKKGRLFTDNDSKNFTDVCVIDETMANTLFGTKDPIGQIIEIRNVPITVVGIIEEAEPYEATYDSLDDYQKYAESNSSTSGVIYVPQACWPNIYNFDEVQNIVIKSDETTNMSTAGKAVADYLNQYITTSDSDTTTYKYKAEDKLQELRNEQELSNETNSMLVWIASISLLVGGIGVMNIMLVSVTERTREIGLKIAIGAPKGKIRAQFLTEAVALTSLGGLIGIVAGIVLAKVISNVMQTPFAISVPAMIVAVVFSMVIGVIFGLFPAIKASNLNPIDALRYE